MKVIPIGEARRRLPQLVRQIAGGHAPILIGRRSRAEAQLSRAPTTAPKRRSLAGMVELVASWAEVEQAHEEIRADIERGLAETGRLLATPRRVRRRSRP